MLTQLLLCALYVAAGKLGLSLAFVNASASPVWPPTGIAIAAMLIFGTRVWPAIFVGAFIVNVTTAGSVATSLAIAAGNALEGVVGATLVDRFAGGRRFGERVRDLFKFAVLAGLVAPLISATVGVTALAVAGSAPWHAFASIWTTWWLGDAAGAILVTPVITLWSSNRQIVMGPRLRVEFVALLLAGLGAWLVVFGGAVMFPVRNYPLTFLAIPPLMWAAFRFGRRAAATAVAMQSAVAVWGTRHGFGPFVVSTENESLLLLQAFMATVAVMTYVVAAVVAEREDALRAMAEAGRAKDEFLAILSHELRTPLNAVVGWASMLRAGGLDEATTARALETIDRNARLQAQLVEDLLDISRVILGRLKLNDDVVPLRSVAVGAVETLRPTADAKRIRLELEPGPELPVRGDAGRLQQVVSNLVSNAIKFTPAGEQITIALTRDDARVRLEVSDTGKGISPEFLPHIFERFRQADSTTRRASSGLGIGLAIVRHLVELHGGTVRATSPGEGQGATFVVELPAAPASAH
jgi:signal transduction histidine kinase